jgi:adenosylmethionine-8-amino-7-oxononanoate aminotransferase
LTGNKLSRVFYSDNGSTAVEVALKIAYQSWANRGDAQRTKFLAFSGSYHGDTFGAMSIGASDGFHSVFDPFRFTTLWVDPVTSHPSIVCPEGAIALEKKIATLDALLAAEHTKLAGVIVEPLVQGAAGMLMQPIQFLKELERLCHKYSLPLIFDEVFTGFGRVGAMFAFQRAGVGPDIVCLAKGLTGGNLPLAVTLAQEQYFEHFLADDKSKALLHGHSYTANAISCRSALTTLDILDRENIIERTLELETAFTSWINTEENRLKLENPRALGGILAFELPHSGLGNYFHEKAAQIPKIAKKYGLFLRPLGNTVYFLPPLVISNAECKFALDALSSVVKELSHDFP